MPSFFFFLPPFAVVQNSMCVEWFTGTNLATAIGITAAFSRLVRHLLLLLLYLSYHVLTSVQKGSIIAYEVSPPLLSQGGYQWCLWVAVFATVFSWIFVLLYVYLSKWAEKRSPPQPQVVRPSIKSILSFSPLYWVALVICTFNYATITPFRSQTAYGCF